MDGCTLPRAVTYVAYDQHLDTKVAKFLYEASHAREFNG